MEDRLRKVLIWYWLPVLLYLGLIFGISSLPNIEIPLRMRFADKFIHCLEYAILGFLLMRALGSARRPSLRASILFSLSFILFWAVSDEIHQGFVPGRTPSISDLAFDLVGGAIGSLLYYKMRWYK